MNAAQTRRRGWRVSALMGLSLLAALALTACGTGAPSAARAVTPTVTPSPTAAPRPTPPPDPSTPQGRMTLLVIKAVGAAAQAVTVAYTPASGEVTVNLTLNWSPGWKAHFDLAQTAAKLACYQAQAALWTSGAALNQVAVVVVGQALDDYSSVITSAYAAAVISVQTARGVDWAAISANQAWQLYDTVFLRPTYAPNWVYLSTSER